MTAGVRPLPLCHPGRRYGRAKAADTAALTRQNRRTQAPPSRSNGTQDCKARYTYCEKPPRGPTIAPGTCWRSNQVDWLSKDRVSLAERPIPPGPVFPPLYSAPHKTRRETAFSGRAQPMVGDSGGIGTVDDFGKTET